MIRISADIDISIIINFFEAFFCWFGFVVVVVVGCCSVVCVGC